MPDTMELQHRVERIENEVARWRWATLGLFGLLAVTVLTGFGPQAADVVRAEMFEVIGEDGGVQASFGMSHGTPRLLVGLSQMNRGEAVFDVGDVSITPAGLGIMKWGDDETIGSEPHTTIGNDGIRTTYGERLATMTVNQEGPELRLSTASTTLIQSDTRFRMWKGSGFLQLIADDGDYGPSIWLGVDELQRAVLGAVRLSAPSTGSTEIRAPGSLVFFDAEGNVLWKAPR